MPAFDRAPRTEDEKTELFLECQVLAQIEDIPLTYDETRDEKGRLICREFDIFMDVYQIMEFRDADAKEDRIELLEFARFTDKHCFVDNFVFNSKLNKLEFVFYLMADDKPFTIEDWKKHIRIPNS